MALYKAKTAVRYGDVAHQIGDTFEVSDTDAVAFGWSVSNATVEKVESPAGNGQATDDSASDDDADVPADSSAPETPVSGRRRRKNS